MKTILLENGFTIDIPKELITYCERNNIDYEYKDARFLFWQENRENTVQFFSDLPVNQKIICSIVFDGFQQLELFINLFHKLINKQFEFKIMNGMLADSLIKFYDYYESSICPDTDEYNDSYELRKEFKEQMNRKFEEVLANHNIIWVKRFGTELHLKDIKTIRENIS